MGAVTFGPNLLAPSGLCPVGMARLLGDRQREEVLDERLAIGRELRLVGLVVENGLCFPQFALNDPADRGGQVD